MVVSTRSLLVKKEAKIIRDLRLMAYFRRCLPRDFNISCLGDFIRGFVSVHPFQLRLSKIHVIDLHCQVTFSTLPPFRLLSSFGSV
jgi:polynucleotide 5'-hydroxyl-kinase GRC3/NOL9